MAWENRILDLPFPPAAGLGNCKYMFVVLQADGTVRLPTSATENCIGVAQNTGYSGEGNAVNVRVYGVTKLVTNGAMANGLFVCSDASGNGQDASSTLQYARGIVLDGTSNSGELASVLLTGVVPSITATAKNTTTVTTDATAGPRTWTAAEFVGGLLLRNPGAAARSDVSPAAAAIVGAIQGCTTGSSFVLTMENTSTGGTVTLGAGAGVTLNGNMIINPSSNRQFLVVVTNATGGSEAVTIYALVGPDNGQALFQAADVTLTTAQLKALTTSGIASPNAQVIVPAPGANLAIAVESAEVFVNFGTVALTQAAGGIILALLNAAGNALGTTVLTISNTLTTAGASSINLIKPGAPVSGTPLTLVANQPVVAAALTDQMSGATADTTITIRVWYRVVPTV